MGIEHNVDRDELFGQGVSAQKTVEIYTTESPESLKGKGINLEARLQAIQEELDDQTSTLTKEEKEELAAHRDEIENYLKENPQA